MRDSPPPASPNFGPILAIETSGLAGSVALRNAGKPLGERALRLEQRHAQTLVPDIRDLLSEFGYRVRDCGLIVVSIGPGSFTGLRIGVMCAKTLAYACQAAIVGIETPRCIVENAPPDVQRLQVIQDAQRQDLFVGRYQRNAAGEWQAEGAVKIVSAQKWLSSLAPGDCVSGPALQRWAGQLPSGCPSLDPVLWPPSAARLAALGEREFLAGRASDPWRLEPLYLRKSAAEEKWDTTHGNQ